MNNKGKKVVKKSDKPSIKVNEDIINDKRFKNVFSDPKFKEIKSNKTKIAVDKRFEKVFDSRFTGEQGKGVDSRGRKISDKNRRSEMSKYYKLQKEQEEDEKLEKLNQLARGEIDNESSTSSSEESEEQSEEESSSSNSDVESEVEIEDEDLIDMPLKDTDEIEMGEETRRLACVNLDWAKVKAVDLYSVFSSFAGAGNIVSVTIYPSQYGKDRMKKEEQYGPEGRIVYTEIEDDEETNEQKSESRLRAYERARLRYYFCVVECDSVLTASTIYKNCDETEYQHSGNLLDLRFIPDDIKFNAKEIVDKCTFLPLDYSPANIVTDVLARSTVDLSWDKQDDDRSELLQWHGSNSKKKEDVYLDKDIERYIASDSENEEDEEETTEEKQEQKDTEKLRQKYLQLLKEKNISVPGVDASENTNKDDENNVDDESKDKEVTFVPGLENKLKQRLESKAVEETETAYEKYRRTMKEKRKQRKAQKSEDADSHGNEKNDDDLYNDDAIDPDTLNDPFFQSSTESKSKKEKKNKKKEQLKETEEEKKQREQLELMLIQEDDDAPLVDDDDADDKYMAKNKRKAQDDFKMDLSDSRFSSLYNDPNYHIDPTSNNYAKTDNMNKLIVDISRKRKKN
ncbi:hypothetical protein WA158_004636 [Blastocystis sp. Blastoise]